MGGWNFKLESEPVKKIFADNYYSVNLIWDDVLPKKMFWRDLDGANIIRLKIMVKSHWLDHSQVSHFMQVI